MGFDKGGDRHGGDRRGGDQWVGRSVELWWLWRCGGCGVVISMGVNGFFFFFYFLFRRSRLIWMMEELG